MAYIPQLFAVYIQSNVYSPSLRLKTAQTPPNQGAISCETVRPLLSCEISFVAIYALLGVSFSAIHGDEWLFHDYDASAGLLTLAQGCQH